MSYFKTTIIDFPGGSEVKNSPANKKEAGDFSFIPGSGRSPGGGNGNPLQYSCLENFMDRGAWRAIVPWGHKESDRTEINLSGGKVRLKNCIIVLDILNFKPYLSSHPFIQPAMVVAVV